MCSNDLARLFAKAIVIAFPLAAATSVLLALVLHG